MSNSYIIALGLAAMAGVAISLQNPINAGLARHIGSSLGATTICFAVGLIALSIASLLFGQWPAVLQAPHAPLVLLSGGLLGAFLVWAALYSVPILGVLTLVAVLILGQITAALVIDHYGLFGLQAQAISFNRLLAAGLVLAGIVLSRF
ncbi:DMT family transporter [Roseovarius sp. MMSF_3281]|uniref:DMT family transporter n=1 Tax=Roseovarius sp. MMSF_3281 TaxID=3046694 RepID=UPI00273D521E|nr:DMT family transporter [Roseovarius sp. MMSF_3281]